MKRQTKLLHAGRHPENHHGIVNPPVYHASTILYPSVAAMEEASRKPFDGVTYGLRGTPTTFAFEDAVSELENGFRTVAVCSGLAAVTAPLLTFLQAGDHLLVPDSVYGPTRRFCDSKLSRYHIETTYYDPMVGAGIADLFRDNSKILFLESPGSLTFEVQDVPAMAALARDRGIITIIDNTWSAGHFFRPLDHGVDISVQAVTKYIGGHSDLMMGSITGNEETILAVREECSSIGFHAAPDDCYLALRGLRSMAARLDRHQQTGLILANWLAERPEVATVLHPALPSCPGHDIWKRDFGGASGLFGLVLQEGYSKAAVAAMLDNMELFPMGYSWGGFESLVMTYGQAPKRISSTGQLLRIHAGLEDPDDLIADLDKGLARLNAA